MDPINLNEIEFQALAEKANGPLFRAPDDLAVSKTDLGRVLIIGSCLTQGMADFIRTKTDCDFILFNNFSELPTSLPASPGSYSFQIVQIPVRSLLNEHTYFRLDYSNVEAYVSLFEKVKLSLVNALATALKWNKSHGLLTFVTNFWVPQQNPMGRLLPRNDLRNFSYFFEQLNLFLNDEVAKQSNVYILDIEQIAASMGKQYIQDDVVFQINHAAARADGADHLDENRIRPLPSLSKHYQSKVHEFVLAMWAEAEALYRTVRRIDAVKLVAVDLDDTMWRGVLADENDVGADDVEGWPLGLAEALLFLKKRGILLAIVSKNDEKTIERLWPSIFGGRLSLDDFAVKKINWNSKAENLAMVLSEVNVLPGSVVFVDDNPVERAVIKHSFPAMRVIGSHPYYVRRSLLWSSETQAPFISDESSRRTEMIRAQISRNSTQLSMPRDEFLKSLELEVSSIELESTDHPRFKRAFELLNKTNQFNTTGRRWSLEEICAYFEKGGKVYAFDVRDRYSDYGLVGCVLANADCVTQMVMSCRVVGLDLELAMLSDVVRKIRNPENGKVRGLFDITDTNLLCRDLFDRCGFTRSESGYYLNNPESLIPSPVHLRMVGA